MLDIWTHIIKFVESDKIKCRTAMTCKGLSNSEFYFHEKIHISRIVKSRWFDYFTNVVVSERVALPLHIKQLTLGYFFVFEKSISNYVPSTVTHLDIGTEHNALFHNAIPTSVTHLSINSLCTRRIDVLIPSSVTHLTIGKVCCGFSDHKIPKSITHLTITDWYYPESKDIPSSVTNLIFLHSNNDNGITYIKKKYCENNLKISFPAYEKKQNKRLRMIGI